MELSDDLKWNNHISKPTAKSNRVLGFIRRNLFKCSKRNKQTAYFAIVCRNLEYASAAWDPYTQTNIKELENIQRRATRFVKVNNKRENSVTLMMQDLKWVSPVHRREVSRLTLFYKATKKQPFLFQNTLFTQSTIRMAILSDLFTYRPELRYKQGFLIEPKRIGTGYPKQVCLPPRWTLLNQD